MIKFLRGNLLKSEADALVNTVNCVGVMGKGLALQFKQTFPDNFQQYKEACTNGRVKLGRMFTVPLGCNRYIINFPTKRHWKDPSRLEDIRSGLDALVVEVEKLKICSIAIPPLGCGNGGLDWAVVKPMIVTAFAHVDEVEVLIFEP